MQKGKRKYTDYIISEKSPVIKFENGKPIDIGEVLIEGAIVKGYLEIRHEMLRGNKKTSRLALLYVEKYDGYIPSKNADMYVSEVPQTALPKTNKAGKTIIPDNKIFKKSGQPLLKYVVPLAAAVIGYRYAKKRDMTKSQTLGIMVLFTGVGLIPYLLTKPSYVPSTEDMVERKKTNPNTFTLKEDYEVVNNDLEDVLLKKGQKVKKVKDTKIAEKPAIETEEGYLIPLHRLN